MTDANFLNGFTVPMNRRSSMTVVCGDMLTKAAALLGSGQNPSVLTTRPTNLMLVQLNLHFSLYLR